jgi:O-acetyl-ADP-ribose deacetylase (regulator of RNase III)
MLEFKRGDLLNEDAEALVNTVNCDGFMGRGVALHFKRAYPENFRVYAAACKRGEVQPGRMLVVPTGLLTNPRFIINFPTKRHWRENSRIEDIEAGLLALVHEIRSHGIRSIALPPLGSGLGRLPWSKVRARIEAAVADLSDVRVIVFEPSEQAPAPIRPTAMPVMTAGRAALLGLMERYLSGLMDPTVTLLEVHKLMYFLQVAGEPLSLRYVEAPNGPYAENLRHVLNAMEGHYINGFEGGGDSPGMELTLLPGALDAARTALADHPETRARFGRVAGLVEGYESAFGLELLATVRWVASGNQPTSPDLIRDAVYASDPRKRRFSEAQIAKAAQDLSDQGWLPGLMEPAAL